MDAEARAAHFRRLYAASADPWRYRTSRYEAGKYAATLAALTRPRYRNGVEIGCSIGVLSARLAARCDRFTAVDLVPLAVARARRRLAAHPTARPMVGQVPRDWPAGTFDLIVLSELVYYLSPPEIEGLADRLAATAATRAEIAVVSYLGDTQTALDGPAAADLLARALGARRPLRVRPHRGGRRYDHRTLILG